MILRLLIEPNKHRPGGEHSCVRVSSWKSEYSHMWGEMSHAHKMVPSYQDSRIPGVFFTANNLIKFDPIVCTFIIYFLSSAGVFCEGSRFTRISISIKAARCCGALEEDDSPTLRPRPSQNLVWQQFINAAVYGPAYKIVRKTRVSCPWEVEYDRRKLTALAINAPFLWEDMVTSVAAGWHGWGVWQVNKMIAIKAQRSFPPNFKNKVRLNYRIFREFEQNKINRIE